MRAGLPSWLGWLGVAAGLHSAATIVIFGWMAWVGVASIVMLVARR